MLFDFPYLLPFLVRIGLDHNLCIFLNNLHVFNFSNTSFVEEVRSVASSGKFYW